MLWITDLVITEGTLTILEHQIIAIVWLACQIKRFLKLIEQHLTYYNLQNGWYLLPLIERKHCGAYLIQQKGENRER